MKTRTNTTIADFANRDEFECSIDEIARIQLQMRHLESERDVAEQKIKEAYNPQISSFAESIEALQEKVASYALRFRERLFGKTKSANSPLAEYGFKTGNKSLVNVSGRSDESVAEQLYNDKRFDCVKVVYKLNSTSIKNALKSPTDPLHEMFAIQQSERFFVQAKTEEEKK